VLYPLTAHPLALPAVRSRLPAPPGDPPVRHRPRSQRPSCQPAHARRRRL